MNLNKKDLRKIIYDFNCISNRLLRSSYGNFSHNLKKFLKHINDTELINDYISTCSRENFDITSEVAKLSFSKRQRLDLGYTDEEEIYTIYNFLLYIKENGFHLFNIGYVYSNETTYDNIIKDFNNEVTLILINHIISYLTKINIEIGLDEEVRYMITNNGGQINISKDSSTLNATQNIGIKSDELIKLVQQINTSLNDSRIAEEEREIIEASVGSIQNELEKPSPAKGLIRSCIAGLKTTILQIPTAIQLCDNINEFINFVSNNIK